jgi:hypothetical protein
MANNQRVASFNLDSFGNGRVAYIQGATFNTVGNAVITIPILGGGLTNAGAANNSGGVIVRRITVSNPSASLANTANVSISTSADGLNLVVANTAFSSLSAAGLFLDLTVASPYAASKVVTGNLTQALYVNVGVTSGGTQTASITVYGDVVSF